MSARADLHALDRALLHRVDALMAWLGVTGRAVGTRQWEGDTPNGRIKIVLTGGHAGAWGVWSAGKTGRGLIGAIACVRGIGYGEAIGEARAFLGETAPADNRRPGDQRAQEARDAAERAAGVADATGIWGASGPLAGQPGDHYLTDLRSIPRPAGGWPECLGWHAAKRMVVAAGTDADGALQFVHRVYLNTDGTNVRRANGTKLKLSRGPMDDAAVRLPGNGDVTLHAEGLETGLSAWVATGNPVLIYAGAVASRMIPQAGVNIVLRDDDAPGSPADKLLTEAMQRWHAAGIDCLVAQPWPERRGDKSDFNDTLRQSGPQAVAAQIAAAQRKSTYPGFGSTRQQDNAGAANGADQAPPEGWEQSHPGRGESTKLLEAPWVPEAGGTVPLTEALVAITHLTSQFFTDAHNAAEDVRLRQVQADAAEAERKAHGKAAKAERLMHTRIAQRNVIVEDIQNRLASGAPMGTRYADARKAEAKAHRAAATADRCCEQWRAAKANLTPPIETPPLTVPHVINSAETGTAKTGIFLKLAKQRIDMRKAAGLPHRIIVPVPALRPDVVEKPSDAVMKAFFANKATDRQRARVLKFLTRERQEADGNTPRSVERLGQQMLKRAREAGINAAVFMGRGAGNCRHVDAVELAQIAGSDPAQTVCGNEHHHCPARSWCLADGYMHGVIDAANADMVIVAHNFIVEDLPQSVREGAWVVGIDEEFATQGDFVTKLSLESITREAFERDPALKPDGTPDHTTTATLIDQLGRVVVAFHTCEGGYLRPDALKDAVLRLATLQDPALQQAELKELRDANWSRWVEPKMHPEMSLDERREEKDRCAINVVLRHIDALIRAINGIASKGEAGAGLVTCQVSVTASGSHNDLIIRGRKAAAAWIAALPVLNLNATPNLDLARQTFPDMTMPAMLKVERPHAETHQILGRWGGYKLAKPTSAKLIADIRTHVQLRMIGRNKGLVVTYKDTEHLFQGIPNVDTAHHGDIAGDDTHRDCDYLLVIGGAFANYEDVASIAAGRGAGAVPIEQPVAVMRVATLTEGRAVAVPNVMAYAHPGVDATHDAIFRASVIQAAGRIDQFRRSLKNTCVTDIMANVIMDRPMTSIRLWSSAQPTRTDKQIIAGQIVFNAAHMPIVHGFYSSERGAESDRWRHYRTVPRHIAAVREIVARDQRPSFMVEYQPAGQGHGRSIGVFMDGEGDRLKVKLEAKLGPLVRWEVRQFTPGTEALRNQLLQDLNRPVRSASADWDGPMPEMPPEGAEQRPEPAHGPPDG